VLKGPAITFATPLTMRTIMPKISAKRKVFTQRLLTILLLMKWFGWTSEKMPAHYARMSTKEIEEAYRRHEERAILGR